MKGRIAAARIVVVLNPFQLPLTVALFAVSVVFTIWPDALEHSPIAYETQGLIHHVWHYSLLAGSVLVLAGMFGQFGRHLQVELAGLSIIIGAMMVNVLALVSTIGQVDDEPSGFGLALRFGIIAGLIIRAVGIILTPVVTVAPRSE